MKNKLNIKNISIKQGLLSNLCLLVFVFLTVSLPAYCSPTVSVKQTAIKFLLAMGGVALSSLLIYIGLTVYNKLFHGTPKHQNEQNLSLKSPENIEEAIDFFIQKNKI